MAKQARLFGELTETQINSGQSYRVSFSYGTFSVVPTCIGGHLYYYVHKRVDGQLYKVYLGKVGKVTKEDLHEATMKVSQKYGGYAHDRSGREANNLPDG
jgi:hypothetical protein